MKRIEYKNYESIVFRFFIWLIFFSTALLSSPSIENNYVYYNIDLKNKNNIKESMDMASPIKAFGITKHGNVDWKIKYSYKMKKKDGLYLISYVKTKVEMFYTLPKIKKRKIPREVKIAFYKYYDKLKQYLSNHRVYAIQAARELEKKFLKIRKNTNPKVLKKNAREVALNILNKYKEKSKKYEVKRYKKFLEKTNLKN